MHEYMMEMLLAAVVAGDILLLILVVRSTAAEVLGNELSRQIGGLYQKLSTLCNMLHDMNRESKPRFDNLERAVDRVVEKLGK